MLLRSAAAIVALLCAWGGASPSASPRTSLSYSSPISSFGDINRDGLSDSVSASVGALRVELSDSRSLLLTDVDSDVVGVAIADVDRDGDGDVVSLSMHGGLDVWQNDGVGRFARKKEGAPALTFTVSPSRSVSRPFNDHQPSLLNVSQQQSTAVLSIGWKFPHVGSSALAPAPLLQCRDFSVSCSSRAPPVSILV